MGGKNFGFPWKILQPANLKGGQKVCKKKGPKRFLIPPTFEKPDQQKSRIFSSKAVFFFDTPPPPPLSSFFGKLLCGLGFLAWNGIVTLWTSTSAKGGVYAATVHFFLADGDLQQRE
jgi:hypothetical protein